MESVVCGEQYLLDLGVLDVDERDNGGEVVRVLVEKGGVDVDVRAWESGPGAGGSGAPKDQGWVCVWEKSLMAAVSRGRGVDVVEVLVKAGVGVEGVDAAGKPLLNVATRLRNADVVRMLVEVGGADVKQTWAGGEDAVVECAFFRG